MYKQFLLFVFFFTSLFQAKAQYSINGKVIDDKSKQTLAFVNIRIIGTNQGISTDIDGRFILTTNSPVNKLEITYVGYETQTVEQAGQQPLLIKLKRKNLQLAEVKIFPGDNPAHRIIRKASENRNMNNPEKMTSFTYTSYNKFYVTADFKAENDTVNSLDTSKHKKISRAEKLFNTQHAFLTESVSNRKFMHPDRNHEEIIGIRTSGLKTPLFTALGTQMQSFSFYTNTIKLFDRIYMNPLVNGSTNKYLFILEDTLYAGKDSIFIISFQPKHGKHFDGLKGVLYINTNQYAVQNVIAEPFITEGLFTIKIQQKYEFVGGKQWFPSQLNSDIFYNDFSVGDTSIILSPGRGKKAGVQNNEGKLKIVSRSYIRDIVIDPPLKKSGFSRLEVEFAPDASEKNEIFWAKNRNDSLSLRDKKTYHVIDSIGKKSNLDFKLKAMSALLDGQIPYKYICFDLNRFFDVNKYERVRAGIGIHSSKRVSGYFTIGGYGAYGFFDKQFKYGGDASIFPIKKNTDFALTGEYSNDIVESAGIHFFQEFSSLSGETFRTNLLAVFDKQEIMKASFRFRVLNYFLCNMYFSDEKREAFSTYRYGYALDNGLGNVTWNKFYFTEAGFQLKYIYREKFSEFLDKRISHGSDYPVVYVNVAKGFNNLNNFQGAYNYFKYEIKLYKQFITAKAGRPSFQLMAGYIAGQLPYTKLFAGRGSFVNYTFTVPNTFETMGMNEFLSDRYFAFFYTHDFGRLLLRTKKFQPQILLVNRVGFGSLSNPSNHFGIKYKTMENGYYETGLMLNNILRGDYIGVGAGLFYRYGPYASIDEEKNIAIKLSFSLNL